jgi:hypothetical protein
MHVLTPNLLPIESRSSVVKDNMSGFGCPTPLLPTARARIRDLCWRDRA